jgi:hypothetical protein
VDRGPAAQRDLVVAVQLCVNWTLLRSQKQAWLSEQWILGFLSGVGYASLWAGQNFRNGVEAYGVFDWIDSYCKVNPDDNLVRASEAFVLAHPR